MWIPEPADPAPDEPDRSRLVPALPIVVLIGALITAAVFGGPRLFDTGDEPEAVATAVPIVTTTAPSAPSRQVPILETALVTVDPQVTDRRARKVVALFETFFTGINERDYQAVAATLDPDGELDPGAPGQMAAFAKGTSTTRDTDIVLRDLTAEASGRLRAEVTFRSEQKAGHGPPERPGEVCTRWRVRYVLSTTGGGYRILRADATDEPC